MVRQLSIDETAKQRSLRLPLDYYKDAKHRDPLRGAKWWLSGIAIGLAVLYGLFLGFGGKAGRRQLSPGPVANVHASWNDDCSACHQDFRPLRSDAVDWRELFTSATSGQRAADLTCIKCHNEPDHHSSALEGAVPGCAACHQDHRGPTADIRRAADAQCLACHQDLPGHRNGNSGLSPVVANVTGFAAGEGSAAPHPDFRSLARDPGNVKFNHWLHLQPGIAPADAKQKLKAAEAAEAAEAYRAYADRAGLVQLECAACHQPGGDGRLMQPIAYEQHCAGCHPLNVPAGQSTVSVPHGLAGGRLSAAIDGLLFQAERTSGDATGRPQEPNAREANAREANESGAEPIVPGRTLGDNLAQRIQADVLGRRRVLVEVLQAKCTQCHYESGAAGASADVVDVRPANLPARWLVHARFDHSAHRHAECRMCHQAAYEFELHDKPRFLAGGAKGGGAVARDDEQVMIAGIESCVKCHAPKRGDIGGARHDCAECHEYHGREAHLRAAATTVLSDLRPALRDLRPARAAELQLVAWQRAAEASPLAKIASCAATGCHGAAAADQPAWKSSFMTWAARDPHVQAYEVLWTARGREMTRLLEQRAEPLSDSAHTMAVERRCTGCHSSAATSDGLGVSCESCHGPTEGWEHTHYRTVFARSSAEGFRDTKDVAQRAAACMPCHVGPSEGSARGHVVNHDLIAAGHPRLAFEFHSYLESLPAHWDRAKAQEAHAGDIHYRLWMAGQVSQIAAKEELRSDGGGQDFAELDCFQCHHALASGARRQASGRGVLKTAFQKPRGIQWAIPDQQPVALAERLAVLRSLAKHAAEATSFDVALQTLLAGRAIVKDVELADQAPGFAGEIDALARYLGRACYQDVWEQGRRPTIYDSPTRLDPDELRQQLAALMEALPANPRAPGATNP